jgi:hypothetical protein
VQSFSVKALSVGASLAMDTRSVALYTFGDQRKRRASNKWHTGQRRWLPLGTNSKKILEGKWRTSGRDSKLLTPNINI